MGIYGCIIGKIEVVLNLHRLEPESEGVCMQITKRDTMEKQDMPHIFRSTTIDMEPFIPKRGKMYAYCIYWMNQDSYTYKQETLGMNTVSTTFTPMFYGWQSF